MARFEPRRRAKLAMTLLATQIENDAEFRDRVADAARATWPELAEALDSGTVPAAADPATLAAAAYLLRPPNWPEIVEAAGAELDRSAAAAEQSQQTRAVETLRGKLSEARDQAQREVSRLRAELRTSRTEVADLRRKLHDARNRAKEAERRATEEADAAAAERAAAKDSVAAAEKELRRMRVELAEARERAETAKRTTREGRNAADARVRVLLDALNDLAQGLRRELALPTSIDRPADTVSAVAPESRGIGGRAGRTLSEQDPAQFDQLLALPMVHLVVDGYNVTKTGYPEVPLADQRRRLIAGLAGLTSRTGAEVTVVFDGADVDAPAVHAPRGVRVRFSAPGETADELIVRLVSAEPPGRPVVVVTSDQEIVDAVRRAGARPASSRLLLSRLRA
ncbi:MAG TPA: NYN domain-containing protein [Streptosporangiaceae bacterium]